MSGPKEPTSASEPTDVFPLPSPQGKGGRSQGSGVPPRPSPLPPPRPGSGERRPAAVSGWSGESTAATDRTAPVRPTPPGGAPTAAQAHRAAAHTRRAKLALRRVDPWSVFVLALIVSLFLGVVTIVAGYVLYGVLDAAGVPASVNKFVATVQGGDRVLTSSRFVGAAALLAALNVVLLSVLATLGALLYNVCATFTGGVELTLAEHD